MEIKIKQVFLDTDMRKGQIALKELSGDEYIAGGDFYFFINKRSDIIKIISKEGMYVERLPKNQTYDLTLRKEKLFKKIGEHWGLTPSVRNGAYENLQKQLRERKVLHAAKRKNRSK